METRKLKVVYYIELRFNVNGTQMRGVTLREVLEWAYKNFIVMRLPFVREEIRERTAETAVQSTVQASTLGPVQL
jgi:hypothetical protein